MKIYTNQQSQSLPPKALDYSNSKILLRPATKVPHHSEQQSTMRIGLISFFFLMLTSCNNIQPSLVKNEKNEVNIQNIEVTALKFETHVQNSK